MRTRGTKAQPLRSSTGRRPGEGGGRGRPAAQRERPAAPEHSTFRRVAAFVPAQHQQSDD
jgi:hypothetical protein